MRLVASNLIVSRLDPHTPYAILLHVVYGLAHSGRLPKVIA